eukprot:m.357338 g.357338  ORF g.357338 m.357338 type:complete len:112 (+) comp17798_c0_seq1:1047-1382(+)
MTSRPLVTLFTKNGCHLCDVVKAVMSKSTREFKLNQINIALPERAAWFERYKYDIPVLHLDGKFMTKHRLTLEQFDDFLDLASNGTFPPQAGDPNHEIDAGVTPTTDDPFP